MYTEEKPNKDEQKQSTMTSLFDALDTKLPVDH